MQNRHMLQMNHSNDQYEINDFSDFHANMGFLDLVTLRYQCFFHVISIQDMAVHGSPGIIS